MFFRKFKSLFLISYVYIVIFHVGVVDAHAGLLEDSFAGFRSIFAGILDIALNFFNYMINADLAEKVFFSEANRANIKKGWSFVRDFVNVFYLLILIFLSIATILRVPRYSDKKLFVGALISAILINFSLPITLVVIDISNLAMSFFANIIAVANDADFLEYSNIHKIWGAYFKEGNGFRLESLTVLFAEVMTLMILAITFFSLALSLAIRYVAFWVLLILSPLAFFSFAWPSGGVKNLWGSWSKKLFSYAFYGPVLLFFIVLSLVLMSGIDRSIYNEDGGLTKQVSSITDFFAFIIPQVVMIYLIFYGYGIARSVSEGAGGMVTNLIDKGRSFSMGALKYGSGYKLAGYGYGVTKDVLGGAKDGIKSRMDNIPIVGYWWSDKATKKRKDRRRNWEKKFSGKEARDIKNLEDAKAAAAKEVKERGVSSKAELMTRVGKGGKDGQAAALIAAQNGMIANEEELGRVLKAIGDNNQLENQILSEVRTNITKKEAKGGYKTASDVRQLMDLINSERWNDRSREQLNSFSGDVRTKLMNNHADAVLNYEMNQIGALVNAHQRMPSVASQGRILDFARRNDYLQAQISGQDDDQALQTIIDLTRSNPETGNQEFVNRNDYYSYNVRRMGNQQIATQKDTSFFDQEATVETINRRFRANPTKVRDIFTDNMNDNIQEHIARKQRVDNSNAIGADGQPVNSNNNSTTSYDNIFG